MPPVQSGETNASDAELHSANSYHYYTSHEEKSQLKSIIQELKKINKETLIQHSREISERNQTSSNDGEFYSDRDAEGFDTSTVIPSRSFEEVIPRDDNLLRSGFSEKIVNSNGNDVIDSRAYIANNVTTNYEDNNVSVNGIDYLSGHNSDYNAGDYPDYYDLYNDQESSQETVNPLPPYRDYKFSNEDSIKVHLPIDLTGLQVRNYSSTPRVWDARQAFLEQVAYKLYLFVPYVLLGFLFGIFLWLIILFILRVFGLIKRQILVSLGKELPPQEKKDELEMAGGQRHTSGVGGGGGVLWKEISDRQMVNTETGDIVTTGEGPGQESGQSSPKSVSSGIGASDVASSHSGATGNSEAEQGDQDMVLTLGESEYRRYRQRNSQQSHESEIQSQPRETRMGDNSFSQSSNQQSEEIS